MTNDARVADLARQLRNYGQSARYHHPVLGLNSRLDELQAAILRVRLSVLEDYTRRRREIAAAYRRGIRHPAVRKLAAPVHEDNHVHHLFVVLCEQRDQLAEHLKARGIESLMHYPIPVHLQEPCRATPRDPKGLPAAEAHARTCLSIPCNPQLTDAEVADVIRAVNEFR